MSIQTFNLAEPFFTVSVIEDEAELLISDKSILLNLSSEDIKIEAQHLAHLQSAIFVNVTACHLKKAVLVEGLERQPDETALCADIQAHWPSAFEVRGEERLRGIAHYMSPKIWLGRLGLTFYHSASIPLNVGLHRDHAFCPVPGFKEVHTQIVGFGKMQQSRERDVSTLYLEEPMAPGTTHRPMYDEAGKYPWHQFETITPSVFMAVEMLPEGAEPPQIGVKA